MKRKLEELTGSRGIAWTRGHFRSNGRLSAVDMMKSIAVTEMDGKTHIGVRDPETGNLVTAILSREEAVSLAMRLLNGRLSLR